MVAMIKSAALEGFYAKPVRIEVDISRGLPRFVIVGLAENSVKEAQVRVKSAIINAGFEFPRAVISVNMAPADIPKDGTSFDLSIALGVLVQAKIISAEKLAKIAFLAELSLNGELKPIRGILALAESLKEQGFKTLIVALENAQEACLIDELEVRIAPTLAELVHRLMEGTIEGLPLMASSSAEPLNTRLDMDEIHGQAEAKRAMLIAAAGNHNVLLIGGPGSGKSMLARRLPTIMPPLCKRESLAVTKIYSQAGIVRGDPIPVERPFRAPHHSVTRAGLAGGGSARLRPGEISLASHGVLFLDELLEFSRAVLEVLREPLEERLITISRASHTYTFPADFLLVAAMNPCPCGHFGQNSDACFCAARAIASYQSRLSGPLCERIDLQVDVPKVPLNIMVTKSSSESSKSLREKVLTARSIQEKRQGPGLCNSRLTLREISSLGQIKPEAFNFLISRAEKLNMSARSFDRLAKIARTIADLEESSAVEVHHMKESFFYRGSASLLHR